MSTSLQAIDHEAFKSYMQKKYCSETAHTPGPWTLRQHQVNHWTVSDPHGLVADVHSDEHAALIASAPDLLAALQEIATHTRRSTLNPSEIVPTAAAVTARAAIAKATEKET